MKPILDKLQSKIIGFGEVGIDLPLPKSAQGDLNRIRFNGTELVDLASLFHMYVTYKNNIFELHARDVPDSQLVTMNYEDKKKLKWENGTISIKTDLNVRDEIIARLKHRARSRAKIGMEQKFGLLVEQFIFTHRLMFVLIWALRTGNAQGLQFVDEYLTEIGGIFDIADPQFRTDLISDYKKIKEVIGDYYREMGEIGEV